MHNLVSSIQLLSTPGQGSRAVNFDFYMANIVLKGLLLKLFKYTIWEVVVCHWFVITVGINNDVKGT